MKKVLKSRIFLLIVTAIVFSGITGVVAVNLASSKVAYDNIQSGSNKTTVQDAIDDLYDKVKHESTLTLTDSQISTIDMGENHDYRYVDASNVYNKGKADGEANPLITSQTKSLSVSTSKGTSVGDGSYYYYLDYDFPTKVLGVSSYTSRNSGANNEVYTMTISGNRITFRIWVKNSETLTVTAIGY